jgi:RNA polymerase sigma factor (TIGR02999 family)
MAGSKDITALLAELQGGRREAADAVVPELYDELRRVAAACLRGEREGHTLQPTALVNEAYLRLVNQHDVVWQNRAHFLAVAGRLMRRILVDHARTRARQKRGGLMTRVTLDDARIGAVERDLDLMALDNALTELKAVDEQLSSIVELRYFGGLTVEEAAEVLGVSPRTVDRAWATARAWLRLELRRHGANPSQSD